MTESESTNSHSFGEALSLLKLVQIGILVSLVWKIRFYWYSIGVNHEFPIEDSFFPAFFRSQVVLIAAYVLAVASVCLSLLVRSKAMLLALAVVCLGGLATLCVHQSSYNDVTFLTCSWASLWCLWMTTRLGEPFETLYPRSALLSHVILSLIFFGAAIGKLTPGYWSGEVLHKIYFEGRNFWTYNLMRKSMSPEALREAAMWHSRMVVITECISSFLWLMPQKFASIVAIVMLCGIALTNNLSLFSVLTCLIALALVGLHDPKASRKERK